MSASVSSQGHGARRGSLARLRAFADRVFEPKLHLAFAGFWSVSLLGGLHVVSGVSVRPKDGAIVVLVLSVFLTLFFLRMVDEVKDHDYDAIHDPDRPLVSGVVTRTDLVRWCVLVGLGVVSLNALIASTLALMLVLDMSYGLVQIVVERRIPAVSRNLLLNLAAVYPVNIGLSVYTLVFFLSRSGVPLHTRQLWLVLAYACAFLHFELARKSAWPELARPGERLYSQQLGLRGSVALSIALGLVALGSVLSLFAPWTQRGACAVTGALPLIGLLPLAWTILRFARTRTVRRSGRPAAVAFLFTFYSTILLHTAASSGVVP